MQSRLFSFVESAMNVVIGYGVAMLAQFAIFPLYGIHTNVSDDFQIAGLFTVVSLIRSYCIRRFFNNFKS